LEDACARLAEIGVDVVRWFALCDLRAGVVFDASGRPVRLDERVIPDFEAALDIVAQYGIGVIVSLFDFHMVGSAERANGVQLRGRSRLLTDRAAREATVERIVTPLVERFGADWRVLAWEVINEPEWVTAGYGKPILGNSVGRQAMRAFIGDVAAAVHASAQQPVTVGSASARWIDLVQGLGLDFYQVHWYDAIDDFEQLRRPVREWLDEGAVLLGEFPTRGTKRAARDVVAAVRGGGYVGALAWSVLGDDEASDPSVFEAAFREHKLAPPDVRAV
jgi:hypothetical protein